MAVPEEYAEIRQGRKTAACEKEVPADCCRPAAQTRNGTPDSSIQNTKNEGGRGGVIQREPEPFTKVT